MGGQRIQLPPQIQHSAHLSALIVPFTTCLFCDLCFAAIPIQLEEITWFRIFSHLFPCPHYEFVGDAASKTTVSTMMGFSTTAESVSCFFFSAWKKLASWDKSRKRRQNQDWAFMEELCRRFSLDEIIAATECFNDKFHIGSSTMGSVYKGYINGGATVVAVKRFTGSRQDFRNEVLLSCQLRHPNLVPVIGFCEEKEELILVYDYTSKGALSSKLFKRADLDPLPWRQRLNICIGIARALHYLHAGLKHVIVHRDVKCSIILLDERFEARVSNLLTFKMGPPSLSNKFIRVTSGRIVGTFGYIDPEYIHLEQFTEKSDVYSFGMVLLEVLTAKWAKEFHTYTGRPDTLCDIMDPSLRGKIAPDCLQKFMDIVYRCTSPTGAERPSVGEVQVELECALELQDSADTKKDACVGHAGDYSYQGMSICEIEDIFSFLFRQPSTSDVSTLDLNSIDFSASDDG